jgi:tetratricopeptide (TPR) repeat protein
MSLIYDYLKTNGKSDLAWNSDAEIPPTLTKSDSGKDSKRHLSKTVAIFLGCSLGIGLIIFLGYNLFAPESDLIVVVDPEPLPAKQLAQPDITAVTPELKVVVQQQEEPAPAVESFPLSASESTESRKAIQIFPEIGQPEINDTTESLSASSVHGKKSDTVRKKIPQVLELSSNTHKITFPEDTPIYTEVKQPVEKVAHPLPIDDDVSMQGSYQPIDSQEKVVELPSRIYSSPGSDSAVLDKSKKLYQAGLNAQQSGDQRIAEIYYKKVLSEFPRHKEAMINLSALYIQQERYIEAEETLAVIIKNDPANSKALVNMGVINLYKYNEPLAEEQFQAALAINPTEENALVNLAYLAERKMDYISAERYYRNLLQINPENLVVLLAYGHLFEGQKRYSEAVALYRDCLKLEIVKLDKQLNDKITRRIRLLAGAVKKSQR